MGLQVGALAETLATLMTPVALLSRVNGLQCRSTRGVGPMNAPCQRLLSKENLLTPRTGTVPGGFLMSSSLVSFPPWVNAMLGQRGSLRSVLPRITVVV